MSFLLDTNVVSETRRRHPSGAVIRWLERTSPDALNISVLTIGELTRGIARLARRDPVTASGIAAWLDGIRRRYRERMAPVDEAVAERWGRLGLPDPLPIVDSLLAATALVHDWTVATRNVDDFRRTGARVINPFESG